MKNILTLFCFIVFLPNPFHTTGLFLYPHVNRGFLMLLASMVRVQRLESGKNAWKLILSI